MATVKDIYNLIDAKFPYKMAEKGDNSGLVAGSMQQKVNRILVTLDITDSVIDEAIYKNIDLIISHHPVLFSGVMSVEENDIRTKRIYKLIRHNISAISAHTNLDICEGGINDILARKLKLQSITPFCEISSEAYKKIVVYIPKGYEDRIRESMADAGAGFLGAYSECSFMTAGMGTFKGSAESNPFIGTPQKLEFADEIRLEMICIESKCRDVLQSMLKIHPYEVPAYELYPIEIPKAHGFVGRIGECEIPVSVKDFCLFVKKQLGTASLKYIENTELVKKVAIISGAGVKYMDEAAKSGADTFITGDTRHYDFALSKELGINLIDAGHFYTENVVVRELAEIIKENFNELTVVTSKENIDIVSYL